MDQLMEILGSIRPDLDFENQDRLIDDKLLDSFSIISIISEINVVFDININAADILPENFNSVDAIWRLIESYI